MHLCLITTVIAKEKQTYHKTNDGVRCFPFGKKLLGIQLKGLRLVFEGFINKHIRIACPWI